MNVLNARIIQCTSQHSKRPDESIPSPLDNHVVANHPLARNMNCLSQRYDLLKFQIAGQIVRLSTSLRANITKFVF